MRVWFSGGEVPDHRASLGRAGAARAAFNVAPIIKQRDGNAGDAESLEPFTTVFYSSQADVPLDNLDGLLKTYSDDQSLYYGLDTRFARESGRYIPVWFGGDVEEAVALAVEHGWVGIEEGAVTDPKVTRVLLPFARRNSHVRIFTVSSKAPVLALDFLTDVIVSGWVAASRFRELQVWDGRKVVRVGKSRRAEALVKFEHQIVNLGGDYEAVSAGDTSETSAVAIASWLQYEKVVATSNLRLLNGGSGVERHDVATETVELRHREQEVFPVATADENNRLIGVEGRSFRQCDMCQLANICPKFDPGATCGYRIDVTVRTTDDAFAAMNTLIEMQLQRVVKMNFGDEILGMGPTKATGEEMDRVFRMFEAMRRIQENREVLTITASSSGGGGALSRLFGARVGEANRALPDAVDIDRVVEESGIIDVDS